MQIKRLIIFTLIISNILIMPYSSYAQKNDNITLYSKSAALIDGLNGTLLYGKDENIPLSMASTTKIMTCIVALENGNPDEYVSVTKNASSQPKVHLGMSEGETYLMRDLLYSLMLESHNDSAVCIAEGVSGSVEDFAILMNNKAKELGLKDTYFITPNGLDSEINGQTHHTTALELAQIMRYCICNSPKKDEFIKITQTKSYSFYNKDKTRSFSCTNHNLLSDMMNGVISGKTGYTSKAGYCYIGAIEDEGRIYIVSLLACGWPNHKNYRWSDAKTLLTYGKNKYFYININSLKIPDDIPDIKRVYFHNSFVTPIDIKLVSNKTYQKNEYEIVEASSKVTYTFNIEEKIYAPYNSNVPVGYINFYIDGNLVKTYSVCLYCNVLEPNYTYFLKYATKLFLMY